MKLTFKNHRNNDGDILGIEVYYEHQTKYDLEIEKVGWISPKHRVFSLFTDVALGSDQLRQIADKMEGL